jgi:two-component system cell cycle response regulator DivK
VTNPDTTARPVLLVEDDSLSLKLMKDVLEANGLKVAVATNGSDGLALVRTTHPALIVMDIGLPDMDGIEVTRSLRADPALGDVPILGVSAYAMHEDEAQMRGAGCDGFMTKPLGLADFAAEVSRLLKSGRPC